MIVQEALVVSQGLSDNADREYVAQNINLAAKLYDGAKLYIPALEENTNGSQKTTNNSQILGSQAQNSLININTASLESLDTLPGIGPVTEQKIISNRPYTNPSDLLNNKIVSSKVYGQIKDKITVY